MGAAASIILETADHALWDQIIDHNLQEAQKNKFKTLKAEGLQDKDAYDHVRASILSDWSKGYTPLAQRKLAEWGNSKITKVEIHRSIQPRALKHIKSSELKQSLSIKGKKDIFRCSIWMQLDNSRLWISVEKNAVIAIKTNPRKSMCEHVQQVNIPSNQPLTLRSFMLEGQRLFGPHFFAHGKENDNEAFVAEMLVTAGMRYIILKEEKKNNNYTFTNN